jgi:hypothetical protein
MLYSSLLHVERLDVRRRVILRAKGGFGKGAEPLGRSVLRRGRELRMPSCYTANQKAACLFDAWIVGGEAAIVVLRVPSVDVGAI